MLPWHYGAPMQGRKRRPVVPDPARQVFLRMGVALGGAEQNHPRTRSAGPGRRQRGRVGGAPGRRFGAAGREREACHYKRISPTQGRVQLVHPQGVGRLPAGSLRVGPWCPAPRSPRQPGGSFHRGRAPACRAAGDQPARRHRGRRFAADGCSTFLSQQYGRHIVAHASSEWRLTHTRRIVIAAHLGASPSMRRT
jgi:hypothetical protein